MALETEMSGNLIQEPTEVLKGTASLSYSVPSKLLGGVCIAVSFPQYYSCLERTTKMPLASLEESVL